MAIVVSSFFSKARAPRKIAPQTEFDLDKRGMADLAFRMIDVTAKNQ